MKTPDTEIGRRLLDAETRGSRWLADGNQHHERGDNTKAEECYAKAQFWLDRANKLREASYG